MFNGLQMRLYPVDNWLEHGIIHQHLIFGVVHDVDQVFVEQPDVDGMNDAAKTNGPIPSGKVPMVVHGKGCDPVPFLQAKASKGLRQLTGFGRDTRPACPFKSAISPTRYDFARAMLSRCIIN